MTDLSLKLKCYIAIFPTTKGASYEQNTVSFFFTLLIIMSLLVSTINVLLARSMPNN
jgi:hypothetical protein